MKKVKKVYSEETIEWMKRKKRGFMLFVEYHKVDFTDHEAVLNFLYELHPYLVEPFLDLPKEQLFHHMVRAGYTPTRHEKNKNTYKEMVENLMYDIQFESEFEKVLGKQGY